MSDSHDSDPAELVPPVRWFVVSFLAYVACGLVVHTLVLNWIVGPTWLVVTLWAMPAGWHRLQRAVRQ